MKNELAKVEFHNQEIIATIINGVPHVAMKPICENMGLNWDSQFRKIKRNIVLSSVIAMMATTGSDGKKYKMLMMPLDYLNGWLFNIDVTRVKHEIKDKVLEYQRECFKVLSEHFNPHGHIAHQPETLTPAQQRHIQTRVSYLVNKQVGTKFSSLWGQIKDKFKVGTYKDIPAARYPELCQFLNCEPEADHELDGEQVFLNDLRSYEGISLKKVLTSPKRERLFVVIEDGKLAQVKNLEGYSVVDAEGYRTVNKNMHTLQEQLKWLEGERGEDVFEREISSLH